MLCYPKLFFSYRQTSLAEARILSLFLVRCSPETATVAEPPGSSPWEFEVMITIGVIIFLLYSSKSSRSHAAILRRNNSRILWSYTLRHHHRFTSLMVFNPCIFFLSTVSCSSNQPASMSHVRVYLLECPCKYPDASALVYNFFFKFIFFRSFFLNSHLSFRRL